MRSKRAVIAGRFVGHSGIGIHAWHPACKGTKPLSATLQGGAEKNERTLKSKTGAVGSVRLIAPTETKVMPVISKFYGIIVRMMKLPDRRTAIYASYREHQVVVDAARLRVISGNAPSRVVDLFIEWARQHHAELVEALEVMNADRSPAAIGPLV